MGQSKVFLGCKTYLDYCHVYFTRIHTCLEKIIIWFQQQILCSMARITSDLDLDLVIHLIITAIIACIHTYNIREMSRQSTSFINAKVYSVDWIRPIIIINKSNQVQYQERHRRHSTVWCYFGWFGFSWHLYDIMYRLTVRCPSQVDWESQIQTQSRNVYYLLFFCTISFILWKFIIKESPEKVWKLSKWQLFRCDSISSIIAWVSVRHKF